MDSTINIRHGRDDERILVLDSFTWQFAEAPAAERVPVRLLDWMMSRILDSWTFLVAVEPENDEILGFIVCTAPNRIAWLQTKEPYRGRGVATALLSTAGIRRGTIETPFMPGRTNVAENFPRWAQTKGYRLVFRPWMPFLLSDQSVGRAGEANE